MGDQQLAFVVRYTQYNFDGERSWEYVALMTWHADLHEAEIEAARKNSVRRSNKIIYFVKIAEGWRCKAAHLLDHVVEDVDFPTVVRFTQLDSGTPADCVELATWHIDLNEAEAEAARLNDQSENEKVIYFVSYPRTRKTGRTETLRDVLDRAATPTGSGSAR